MNKLYNKINTRTNHGKLYKSRNHEQIRIENHLHGCLYYDQIKSEALCCFLQDMNIVNVQKGQCPHCGRNRKTVDYLATRSIKC